MKITHRLIIREPRSMRYCSVGDYHKHGGIWSVDTADLRNKYYNFLIHLHELVELALVEKRGIKQTDIDRFDIQWEKDEASGKHEKTYPEAGDDPAAPYHKEHMFALKFEKEMCRELGFDWKAYNKIVDEVAGEVAKFKLKED